MFKLRGRFVALLLAVLMVISSLSVTVVAAQVDDDGGCNFDQMLEQMRAEFFRPAVPSGLEQVFVDLGDIEHTPLDLSGMPENERGIVPFGFISENYQEGSTRIFRAHVRPGGTIRNNFDYVQGNLVRQGNHVNIWVVDPDSYNDILDTLDYATASRLALQSRLAEVSANNALLDDMIMHFDGIVERMTGSLGAFAGVRVATSIAGMPYVGDIHQDGRVNVLLYTVRGQGGNVGFFTDTDYYFTWGGSTPIPLIHVDISTTGGFSSATQRFNNPNIFYNGVNVAGIYYVFAHELQHLLFHMHFKVYLTYMDSHLWDYLCLTKH